MRKMFFGLSAAVVVAAGIALFASSVFAANLKPCWAHSVDGVNYSAVWASGGGHPHAYDIPLGSFATAEECQAAFDAL